ncbi:MAG: ATP phosphoribosyltransferase [Deltaproteobacteria bacterium]|nr:MAG: ATP phosphoribosyltransferase [Deltaproteobacteria bacterium]
MTDRSNLRFALPKGRMQVGVLALLGEAGIKVRVDDRGYRPSISLDGYDIKILKPQNIVEMLHFGSRDVGFAGADWVAELDADLVELLDTGLDPVRIVAAAPNALVTPEGGLPAHHLTIAAEYERLTRKWIAERGLDATFVRSYGATEVFPPEDADVIVDNTATGSTLRANGLTIVDDVMRSSTRLYANPRALEDPHKKVAIDHLVMLLRSVLEARHRVMLEVNVSAADLDGLIEILPCMRHPTIAQLHAEDAYAVKAAVPRSTLPTLIPQLKARGGSDIVITNLSQIVP